MPGLQDLACSLCQHNGLFSLSLNKYSQCMTTNMKLYSKDQIMLKPLVLEQCIMAVVSFFIFYDRLSFSPSSNDSETKIIERALGQFPDL